MKLILGYIIVLGSVIGGYVLHDGKLGILYQPTEYLIIVGAGFGAFTVANPPHVIKAILKGVKKAGGKAPFTKAQYIELLLFLYNVLRFMKTKGLLEIESHLEDPHNSNFFTAFPSVLHNHHAVDFFCDYIRLLTMGMDNKYQLDDMMTAELDAHHNEKHVLSSSMTTLADSFPAIGIVAAVLGVIITMGSISEPPEVLGHLIGGALVGTFLGILLSYCFFAPVGQAMDKYFNEEHKYFECIKIALLSHIQGNAPVVSVEFARKVVPTHVMPSFKEVEEAIQNTPAP